MLLEPQRTACCVLPSASFAPFGSPLMPVGLQALGRRTVQAVDRHVPAPSPFPINAFRPLSVPPGEGQPHGIPRLRHHALGCLQLLLRSQYLPGMGEMKGNSKQPLPKSSSFRELSGLGHQVWNLKCCWRGRGSSVLTAAPARGKGVRRLELSPTFSFVIQRGCLAPLIWGHQGVASGAVGRSSRGW